jgi:hypothetical protein
MPYAEHDLRIKVFWTYYCLTSVEHAVESVKMYGCTVSRRMDTVLSLLWITVVLNTVLKIRDVILIAGMLVCW